jgi:hypothetical protein
MKKGSKEFIDLLGAFERTVSAFPMIRVGGLAREKMDTKHAYYQDGKTNEAFICFMQGAAYKKADMLDVVNERDALRAELAALKAQNADLLKALQNLTENVVFYHRNGISDLKDAKADRNNAVKIALIAIGIEADPDLEFSDWQPSPAIAKARGWS